MSLIVPLLGLLILAGSIVMVVAPSSFRKCVGAFVKKKWLPFAALFRLVVGVLFVIVADETRFPIFILVFGILMIAAGLSIPLIGFARIERFAEWWLHRSNVFLRLFSMVSAFFGAFLFWSGV